MYNLSKLIQLCACNYWVNYLSKVLKKTLALQGVRRGWGNKGAEPLGSRPPPGEGRGSPAIAEQPAREGAVRCQPMHEGGSEQGHHQLHSKDRLRGGDVKGSACQRVTSSPSKTRLFIERR